MTNPKTLTIAALAALPIAWLHRTNPLLALVAAIAVIAGVMLSEIDLRERRLPNAITLPLAAGTTIAIPLLALIHPDTGSLTRSLIVGSAAFALMFLLAVVAGMGMGDVKYSLSIGLLLGWIGQPYISIAVLVTVLTAALVAVTQAIRNRALGGDLALGPFLFLGLWAALFSAGIAS